jgi:protocatechuate 3,4-dioxygenase beta subunit
MQVKWTRRTLLERCATFGALSIAIPASLSQVAEAWTSAENKKLAPTPPSVLGPFYKRQAPSSAKLRSANDAGMPLALSGVVYSVNGEVLQNAKVEVWQTDHFGHYDNEGYRFRAMLESDAKGSYAVDSVLPGHYPDRVCQHVHYLVTAPGHKTLVTQLYFGSDPVFEGNPAKNYTRDPLIGSVELVRPVTIKGDPKEMIAAVTFDLVLEKS